STGSSGLDQWTAYSSPRAQTRVRRYPPHPGPPWPGGTEWITWSETERRSLTGPEIAPLANVTTHPVQTDGLNSMAESNATPTPGSKPGPLTRPGQPRPSAAEQEAAIDDAMDKALSGTSGAPTLSEVPLKRQWDDELEAEMEAALAGFDPKTFD